MKIGFPVGRPLRSDELIIDESDLPYSVALTWLRHGAYRELTRFLSMLVCILFVVVGTYSLYRDADNPIGVCFILVGLLVFFMLHTRLQIVFLEGGVLQKVTSVGSIVLVVETYSLPEDCICRTRRVAEIDGPSSYLCIEGENFAHQLFAVEGWDNYEDFCEKLNEALSELNNTRQNKR
jgi:hypothetical protein